MARAGGGGARRARRLNGLGPSCGTDPARRPPPACRLPPVCRQPRDRLPRDATADPIAATVGRVNIVFVEPGFPANQRRFALALAAVGANVFGIGESDEWALDDELRGALSG